MHGLFVIEWSCVMHYKLSLEKTCMWCSYVGNNC